MLVFFQTLVLFFVIWLLYLSFLKSLNGHLTIISPIKGVLIGGLYHREEVEGVMEHTVQFAFFVINFTFLWETPIKQ